MRRVAAIALVALGTVLFGVATGLVYVDSRSLQVRAMELYERGHSESPFALPKPAPGESDPIPNAIIAAMALGPLGAGMGVAGILMFVADLRWFRHPANPLPTGAG